MKKDILKYSFIILTGCFCVAFDAMLRLFHGMRLISPRAMMFSMIYGILFSTVALLFKRKTSKRIYLIVLIIFLATLAFSQSMYYSFFSDFYSFTRLTNLREFLVVKGETLKAFEWHYLAYYVVAAIYIALLFVFPIENKKRCIKGFIVGAFISIVMISGVKMTFVNKMDDPTQLYLTDDYLYSTLFNKSMAMERFGVYSYSQRDVFRIAKNTLGIRDQKEVDEINEYFNSNQRTLKTNEKTGVFEGKNLVFILAESLNTWGINEEITPNLYKMKTEGYYFLNYYSPTFPSTTIDAEFVTNTSIIPSLDFGNTAYQFSDNVFPQSLANLFKEKGYTATSFHNSIGSFYNRYQFHEALGYDHFYDSKEMEIEVPDNFGYNWALDVDLFDKSSNILLKQIKDSKQPFMAYLITVSTHTPYDENRIALKDNYKEIQTMIDADSQVQYYMAAAKDLDDGIGLMMGRFEDAGILNDTVFVLFSDHYSYGMYHDIIWSYYTDYSGDFHRLHNVPFIIWTPQMNDGQIIENACSQFEVFPTVANLFNLDYDPTYTVGNDVFNGEENIIVYGKRSSWQDNNLIYENNDIYEFLKEDVDISYIEKRNSEIIERLDLYQKVLKQNYFGTEDFKEKVQGGKK